MKVFGKYRHKLRNSGSAAAIIAVLSIQVLAVVGYVMNIVALVGTPLAEFGMMEIVGIFVASRLCDWLLLRWSNATSDLSFYSSLVL